MDAVLIKDAKRIIREGIAMRETGRYLTSTLGKLPELMRDFERVCKYEWFFITLMLKYIDYLIWDI